MSLVKNGNDEASGAAAPVAPLLSVRDLRVKFPHAGQGREVLAVAGVSFDVHRGELVSLVGETGSGKSATAAAIMGLTPHPGRTSGSIHLGGRSLLECSESSLRRIRGREMGLVVQNTAAALNPLLPIRRQMANVVRAHKKMSRRETAAETERLLALVGLADRDGILDALPQELSGGMRQRVVIAMVMSMRPSLIIADEPTTGLDATVQREVLNVLVELIDATNAAAIVVTHDLAVASEYTERILVMHAGQIVEDASTQGFFEGPAHPYSVALLASLRDVSDPKLLEYVTCSAEGSSAPDHAGGCLYRDRCPLGDAQCKTESPGLTEVGPRRMSRCHHTAKAMADGTRLAENVD